ncbi:hypothetical protein HHI36_021787 [Cryptolaemus montrouzieri]|uniref:Uncharacterized protein n=1 Tax=Cryptolaemus montrouzieri TaxID=559131 RepID=A0ABD2MXY9_9CUCU
MSLHISYILCLTTVAFILQAKSIVGTPVVSPAPRYWYDDPSFEIDESLDDDDLLRKIILNLLLDVSFLIEETKHKSEIIPGDPQPRVRCIKEIFQFLEALLCPKHPNKPSTTTTTTTASTVTPSTTTSATTKTPGMLW